MKCVCISDTHRHHREIKVPNGDLLIYSGDIGLETVRQQNVLYDFNTWLGELPHKHKIIVAGNHDWLLYHLTKSAAKQLFTNATYLDQEEAIIDGLKIYGDPRQPAFCNWAWNIPRGEPLKKVWSNIPNDTNILVTHGPPYGILDNLFEELLGDEYLLDKIKQLNNLKLHVFGHIHNGYGKIKKQKTTFVNASICTEEYEPINKPIVVNV